MFNPSEGWGQIEDRKLQAAAAACLEKPRFDELSTVEALTLLGPWVYNLGSASALGDMISEICPIFFTVSLCLSFLFQNNSVLVFFFF